MTVWFRTAVGDILDQGAVKRNGRAELPDLWRVGALVCSTGLSLSATASEVATDLVGLPGSIVPVVLVLASLVWACFLVTSKTRRAAPLSPVPSPAVYAYHQPIRSAAKLAVPFLVILFIQQGARFIDDVVPLPTSVYGYLVDGRTGTPAEGATVRIVDASGDDVTTNYLPSDTEGFYIVHTSRRVQRNATAVVTYPDCANPGPLRLYRTFETNIDAHGTMTSESLWPVFRHTLKCSESQ